MPGHLRRVREDDPSSGDGPSDTYREGVVAAWWQRSDRLRGPDSDPDAACALDWAAHAVSDVLEGGTADDATAVLDDLLAADRADPAVVGCGPLQNLLRDRGPDVEAHVLQFCYDDPAWRAALAAACLTAREAAAVPHLGPFLS